MRDSIPKSWTTKLTIFQAALALLSTSELEEITIRGIAQRANVSIGTFYYYYKTKFDVFYQAHHFMDDYFENVVASTLPGGGAYEQLTYYFDQYCYYNAERTPFKLYKVLTQYANPNYQDHYAYGIQRVLNDIIKNAQSTGQLTRSESSEEIAQFLLTCVRGCFRHWAIMDNSYDIKVASARFVKKLLRVYLPQYMAQSDGLTPAQESISAAPAG